MTAEAHRHLSAQGVPFRRWPSGLLLAWIG